MSADVIFGFDYGTHHIGLAVGQRITRTATPLMILPAKQGIPNWQSLAELVETWKPERFVVGLPLNMDASGSEMSARAEKFARRLAGRFNRPYEMIDERLSSIEAKALSTQHRVDDIAAVLILETWFSQQSEPLTPKV
jgi:putative Holliday junction resolvase